MDKQLSILVLIFLDIILPAADSLNQNSSRSFVIDYENDRFLKDGQPFRFVSGEIHYFRIPRPYWKDRLQKYRAAGLNTITMYIEWSTHEPEPGKYLFTGQQDVEYFIRLATAEGLLVILRPGPFICAERDFGGFPYWLLSAHPNITLRTDDANFKFEVKKWMDVLMPRLIKYLYSHGGVIIMVQVENEYGLLTSCNNAYKLWIRDLYKSYVHDDVVLFTIDPFFELDTGCGVIPGVYTTVDFGTDKDPSMALQKIRKYYKHGPLVCMEYYTSWIDVWGQPSTIINTEAIINGSKHMLDMGVSFSYYAFHGGTNFGFKNGANELNHTYEACLTSYNYNAPINESGDPTDSYYAIKNLLSQYYTSPQIPVPRPSPKNDYGVFTLKPILSVFDYQFIADAEHQHSNTTKTFEELNLDYGYLLYETCIPEETTDAAVLKLDNLHDRATVYLDYNIAGVLSRHERMYSLSLLASAGKILSILVENQGRINIDLGMGDKKGLLTVPTLNEKPLFFWNITKLPLKNVSWVQDISPSDKIIQPPAFYSSEFVLTRNTAALLDTFIDFTGWGKGVAFINGFNLGRYWPSKGPQVTLYLPGCYLNPWPTVNVLTVFETEKLHPRLELKLGNNPILDRLMQNKD